MKLSKEQKKILKSIPNNKIRLEHKLQFKIQNKKENAPLNLESLYPLDLGNGGTLFRRKWSFLDEPKEASLKATKEYEKGFLYKGKIFDTMEEALEYSPMSSITKERIKEIHENWKSLSNMDFAKKFVGILENMPNEKESKVKVEMVKDEKLKGTRYEDCFF